MNDLPPVTPTSAPPRALPPGTDPGAPQTSRPAPFQRRRRSWVRLTVVAIGAVLGLLLRLLFPGVAERDDSLPPIHTERPVDSETE